MAATPPEEGKSPASDVLTEISPQPTSLQALFEQRKKKAKGLKSTVQAADRSQPSNYHAWKQSQNIPDTTKVYTVVSGQYPDVHVALQRRGNRYPGYIENPQEETGFYDFRWSVASKLPETIEAWQTVNHFPEISHISTKLKFSRHIKDFLGQKCDDVFPRTYLVKGWDQFLEFDFDYKSTQARSILRRFVAGEDVPLEKVTVSLVVCRATLQASSPMQSITELQWKVLRSLTPEITAKLYSQTEIGPVRRSEELKREAEGVLSSLAGTLSQYYLDGVKNVWIVKPGGKSRGREIFLHNGLEEIKRRINVKQSWIIQKYIENPLLIHNRKFDIRQWVLITSIHPLTVWIYEECYLRFSAEQYDIDTMDNKYAHLTNNSVVKYSDHFDGTEIEGCMWDWTQFRDHLIRETGRDVYTETIRPQIKEVLLKAVQSAQAFVTHRERSFELLGFDLMVDTGFHTWLLEGNTSPAMDYSTPVTERLVKQVLEDTIKVVLDHGLDPSASTGLFTLLHQG